MITGLIGLILGIMAYKRLEDFDLGAIFLIFSIVWNVIEIVFLLLGDAGEFSETSFFFLVMIGLKVSLLIFFSSRIKRTSAWRRNKERQRELAAQARADAQKRYE